VSRDVVLVPGLWVPGAVMVLLARRLAHAGFRPHIFAYRGRRQLDANAESLARFTRERCGTREAHFVGHSLGGVLVLETLNRFSDVGVSSAVLLGAPVRGCLAGRRLASARVGRWMMGACQRLWDEHAATWLRPAPLGVVAGVRPLGLGRALGPLPGHNDGVVCVEETTVEGMRERTLVGQGHSMLIVSSQVARRVERFLAAGSFA
jgi:pimeloyl-ACP methyl ester carboxylesterase